MHSISNLVVPFRKPPNSTKPIRKGFVTNILGYHARILSKIRLLHLHLFCLALLSCPSLQADIIYNVPRQESESSLYINTNYGGNSFKTKSNSSVINSISLYLSLQKSISDPNLPSGLIYVSIYSAIESPTPGLYVPDFTNKLATSNVDISIIPETTYATTLTTFNFREADAINLEANTRYAFSLYTTDATYPMMSRINYLINNSGGPFSYTDGNLFNSYYQDGSSVYDMSGEIDVTAVPEPGTLILFGMTMAVGGAVAIIRKRRKRITDSSHLGFSLRPQPMDIE